MPPQRRCHFFQRGNCYKGTRCSFLHERDSYSSPALQERAPRSADEQAKYDDLSSWKRLLRDDYGYYSQGICPDLWTRALTILDTGDRHSVQKLIDCLVDSDGSEGLRHVKSVLDLNEGHCRSHGTVVKAFLRVITHTAILDCLSIDTQIGDLYKFIAGSGGVRAVHFFRNVSSAVLERQLGTTGLELEQLLLAVTTGLFEVLRRNDRSRFADGMSELLDRLAILLEASNLVDSSTVIHVITTRLDQMRGMVRRARGDLAESELDLEIETAIRGPTSTYPRDLVLPHSRHDNDNLDITKIQILPTLGELRSDCKEFLPSTDPDQPHFLEGVERLLDTHFRLLRHDALGELKSVIGGLVASIDQDPKSNIQLDLCQIRAFSYSNSHVNFLNFDRRNGLEAHISFPQPVQVKGMSEKARGDWWREGNRFEVGSLLCLITAVNGHAAVLFLLVTRKDIEGRETHHGLASDSRLSSISARLAKQDCRGDLELLLQLHTNRQSATLIEFPGILLATFAPILENLQDMQRCSRLPFQPWILPSPSSLEHLEKQSSAILAPAYARRAGFTFSLDTILKQRGDIFDLDNSTSPNDETTIKILEDKTTLDRGQCQALITALVQEFSLIQGPPGTGKSYLGVHIVRALLANKYKADLGPIIVVCFTNHALDQFLESLDSAGIDKIIRIGGQSNSKVLEGKNLRLASKEEGRSRAEGWLVAKAMSARAKDENIINSYLNRLRGLRKRDWKNLGKYLRLQHPQVWRQFLLEEEGWEFADNSNPFDIWSKSLQVVDAHQSTIPLTNLLEKARSNVNDIAWVDRLRLIDHWVEESQKSISDVLFDNLQDDYQSQEQLKRIYSDADKRVLQTADVIGVTTSGLAKQFKTLRHVKAKVFICEEAGEVLESHFLSALLPSVEQVIQIGDHQQLRPQINNFELSLESAQGQKYQLDRSNFERLSVGENRRLPFPVAQLNIQRRMRPEISALIRTTMYPRLSDNSLVLDLPDVVGMRRNVFWLDHKNLEAGSKPDDVSHRSHSNDWEVEMVHALVRHIVRQGEYKSKDIAVLTPYSGQLQKLRKNLQADFEIVLSDRDQDTLDKEGFSLGSVDDVMKDQTSAVTFQRKSLNELLRIATIDNFQGEEAKVVIVSLVRSNPERKVGFLKTKNRINVLLSRAQHGLYLIGNSDTAASIPMWSDVIGILRAKNNIGHAFGLCCPRHTQTEIQVSTPEDFSRLSPEGGCNLPCDRRLEACGHRCYAKCHSEQMHRAFACPQPCQRLHTGCEHACPKACGEACGKCKVAIDRVDLPCGHTALNIPCHIAADPASILCHDIVAKTVPKCGHKIDIRCHQDIDDPEFMCTSPCPSTLSCDHNCTGTCGSCKVENPTGETVVRHQKCNRKCLQTSTTCSHSCQKLCHDGGCGLCTAQCQVKCGHSRCDRKCHEPCSPCIQKCTWVCEHQGQCSMPCAAPCDRLPCNLRCSCVLDCGHQCPSLCGEECPTEYCQLCCSEEKKEQRVDMIMLQLYSEIDLNDTPIVVLSCGHFFTFESLDGIFQMNEVYKVDNGQFCGLQDRPSTLSSLPGCPDCRSTIQQFSTRRFNRVVNQAVQNETMKRFHTSGQVKIHELVSSLEIWEKGLENSRQRLLDDLKKATHPLKIAILSREIEDRANGPLAARISNFIKSIDIENQPQRKLHDAVVRSRQQTASLGTAMSQLAIENVTAPDQIILLGGQSLQINSQCVYLSDQLILARSLSHTSSGTADAAASFFPLCEAHINECGTHQLPRLDIQARIFWAHVAFHYQAFAVKKQPDHIARAQKYIGKAKELLEAGKQLCAPINASVLENALENTLSWLGDTRYQAITEEERLSVTQAMRQDLGSSTGHWYNCANGHPFSVGECGLPMEQARCPECGAPVGGQHHTAAAGVTQAREMDM